MYLIQSVRVRALQSSENNKFTFVNVCFQNKRNKEIGHSGQTLN